MQITFNEAETIIMRSVTEVACDYRLDFCDWSQMVGALREVLEPIGFQIADTGEAFGVIRSDGLEVATVRA